MLLAESPPFPSVAIRRTAFRIGGTAADATCILAARGAGALSILAPCDGKHLDL